MAHRQRRSNHALFLDEADPSAYMIGLPKSRPKVGSWLVFTVVVGGALAFLLFAIEIFIF
jgi:hypothetical protein